MIRSLLAGAVLVLLASPGVQAQDFEDLRGGAGAFFTYAESGDITILVKLWGSVGNPGLYEVRQGIPLSTLLTLAGGPNASESDPRSRRTLTIRLYRDAADGPPTLLYETVMEDQVQVLSEDPTLMHGDTVVIEERVAQRFGWRDGISILTAVSAVVLLVERLVNFGN